MIAIREWPPFRPNIPTINTGTYMDVIQEADNAPGYGRRDGAVSRDELSNYSNNLQNQVQLWSWWGQWFGGGPFGDWINRHVQNLQTKLDAANVMQDHFGTFATGGRLTEEWRPADNTISYGDVWNVADNDGNASTVSSGDLPFIGWRPPFPYPLPLNAAAEGTAGTATTQPQAV